MLKAELFERLLTMVEHFEGGSQAQFARKINVFQQTFNSYLNLSSQQKIRKTLLDQICAVYPQVNKYWLFFGEGEMLDASYNTPPVKETESPLAAALAEIVRLNQENRELRAKLDEKDGK